MTEERDFITATEVACMNAEYFQRVGIRFPKSKAQEAIDSLASRMLSRLMDRATEIEMEDLLA